MQVRATQTRGRGIGITTYAYGLSCEGGGKDDADGGSDVGRAEAHKSVGKLLNPSSPSWTTLNRNSLPL